MFKVVIDPGHGGEDPGAVGPGGVQEKSVNLAVAKRIASLLSPVAEVRLTRTEEEALGTDDRSDLYGRAALANEWVADCFVSIHCNGAADPSAHGTETYHYPDSGQGRELAQAIHSRLIPDLGLTDRGVKQANFKVLRQTDCPACLVELAFISNPEEERLLENRDFQETAAQAVAAGIADFLGACLQPAPAPETVAPTNPELDDWKLKIVREAREAGLISQDHDPDESGAVWFVLAIALNLLKVVKG
ncbi:N-acetylmuramoyl-L-alanine amidase family protein [Pelotomaculum propionicicum]|uniref:N-acetylmuramoyl-L-alanine amidase family protein n=1 Tax=Pelotomaculum propionicicum TaxID=258475 RepID=UPI003B7F8078